jgi:hypothetical protein
MITAAEVELRGSIGQLRPGALAEALERAERCVIETGPTAWTLAQALAHCAQAIEYSMTGFPRARGRTFQALIGGRIKRRFLRRGVMFHNRAAAIPGADPISRALTRDAAMRRLRRAVEAFDAHAGPLAPHFAYGPTSKAEYEVLHAMHLVDHLSAFDAVPAAS